MTRFLTAALLVGAAWTAPAAAATFAFRFESAPDEVYLGGGDLALADPDADGLRRITGVVGDVRYTYRNEELNRWAIVGLADFRSNLLTADLTFASVAGGEAPGMAFRIDGGPSFVVLTQNDSGHSIFIGEIGGPVQVTITPSAAAVPEPAAWAMMIGGFGLVGGAARYRRRTTRAAFA